MDFYNIITLAVFAAHEHLFWVLIKTVYCVCDLPLFIQSFLYCLSFAFILHLEHESNEAAVFQLG